PELQTSREPFEHPHPGFGFGFAGDAKPGFMSLVHGHAFGDELVPAQHAVDELSDLAVVLETAGVRPGLVIEHEDIRSPGDGAKIAKAFALAADGPAVHAGPYTLGAARGASDLVIEGPQLEAAVIVPADPGFVGAGIPIRLQGKIEIRFVFKIFAAVVAVADRLAAQPAPTVVGEPFRMIER